MGAKGALAIERTGEGNGQLQGNPQAGGDGREHAEHSALVQMLHRDRGTVVNRAKACGLEWPLPDEMNGAAIRAIIYPHKPVQEMRVDHIGDTMEVVDVGVGEVPKVYVFAVRLSYSGELVVNEQRRRMVEYYLCAVVPARPKRPRVYHLAWWLSIIGQCITIWGDGVDEYRQHRKALLEVIGSLCAACEIDYAAALATDGEVLARIEQSLEECGEVRLYKYQPFSERNLMDCSSGVLHLTPLTKLNDVNEGLHIFDAKYAASRLCGVNPEQVSKVDFDVMPDYVKDIASFENLQVLKEGLSRMKKSGELQSVVAPSLAREMEASFRSMRENQLCGSLSETVRSASMWDRYANAHTGFAVGYTISSFSVELTRSRNKSCFLGYRALIAPVHYGNRVEITALASAAQIRNPNSPYATNIASLMLVTSLLQKAREWEHELEWRAVANACPNSTGVQYCRIKPDSVYLGIDMQEDERNRALEVARQNQWNIFRMERSLESPDWALEAKRVD